ncbi:MAG: hypothetical protein R6X33_04105 [Candidatus Brocadiia bacterium]
MQQRKQDVTAPPLANVPFARLLVVVSLACILTLGPGCSVLGVGRKPRVVPFPNAQTAALSPEQTIELMSRSGLTKGEMEKIGLELRNALAQSGAARIYCDGHTAAIYVVHDGLVHAATWRRGSFLYDLESGDVTSPDKPPPED